MYCYTFITGSIIVLIYTRIYVYNYYFSYTLIMILTLHYIIILLSYKL